jgi:hypothetical protein
MLQVQQLFIGTHLSKYVRTHLCCEYAAGEAARASTVLPMETARQPLSIMPSSAPSTSPHRNNMPLEFSSMPLTNVLPPQAALQTLTTQRQIGKHMHALSAMASHQPWLGATHHSNRAPYPQLVTAADQMEAPDPGVAGAASVSAAGSSHAICMPHMHTSQGIQPAPAHPTTAATTASAGVPVVPRSVLAERWRAAATESGPPRAERLRVHSSMLPLANYPAPALKTAKLWQHTAALAQGTAAPHRHSPQQQALQQQPQHERQLPPRTPTPARGAVAVPVNEAAAMLRVHGGHAHSHQPGQNLRLLGPSPSPSAMTGLDPHAQQEEEQGQPAAQSMPRDLKREVGTRINEAVARMKTALLATAPGTQLRICSLLGSGGFGTVYLGMWAGLLIHGQRATWFMCLICLAVLTSLDSRPYLHGIGRAQAVKDAYNTLKRKVSTLSDPVNG